MSDARLVSAITALEKRLSSIDNKLGRLREDIGKLVEISKDTNQNVQRLREEVKRTRLDLAVRLHLLSIVMGLLDYVSVSSKLETLRGVRNELQARLSKARELYVEKLREIIRDYMSAVDNFLSHFLGRARGDLDLIRATASKDEVVREMYRLLDPERFDPEVVKLALEYDTAERARDVRGIFEVLTDASGYLERASRLEEDFRRLLSKYEADLSSEAMLFIPVIRVEAQLDGTLLERICAPAFSWEKVPELSKRAAKYSAELLKSYPVAITREQVARVKQLLVDLAKSDDERRLIEEMEVV